MKFLVIILLGIALYGNTSDTYAWDSTAAKYMPLQVGNVWVYTSSVVSSLGSGTSYDSYKITGIRMINGKLYFDVSQVHIQLSGNNNCGSRLFSDNTHLRIDSVTMNLVRTGVCNGTSEGVVDSLGSKFGDSSLTCFNINSSKTSLNDSSEYFIFSSYYRSKKFATVDQNGGNDQTYLYGIGLAKYYASIANFTCNQILKGCVINGIVYGDTSMIIGINQISTGIPERFELSQNYPNPFNPTTKIKFAISGTSAAQTFLSVYDILGHEVAILVNQQLQPGTYEADWDASAYPSGVYYYKLEGDNFIETKKMVLIK